MCFHVMIFQSKNNGVLTSLMKAKTKTTKHNESFVQANQTKTRFVKSFNGNLFEIEIYSCWQDRWKNWNSHFENVCLIYVNERFVAFWHQTRRLWVFFSMLQHLFFALVLPLSSLELQANPLKCLTVERGKIQWPYFSPDMAVRIAWNRRCDMVFVPVFLLCIPIHDSAAPVIYLWSKFLLYFPCHRCIHSRPYQWIIVSKFGSVWKLITTHEIGMKMNFDLWTQFFDSKYHFWWCFRYRWSNGFQFLKNFRWFYYVMYDHRFPNHTICHRSIPQMMRSYLAFYPTNIQWLPARFLFR